MNEIGNQLPMIMAQSGGVGNGSRTYHQIIQPPCHVEGQFVFQIGHAKIHAGSSRAPKEKRWDLVINLSGYSNMSPDVQGFNGAEKTCAAFVNGSPTRMSYPELCIDWADGRAPFQRRKDWRRLVSDLQGFHGDVLIHCIGGHGRTGTLLVVLGVLSGAIPQGEDPVLFIRTRYCKKTVESYKQLDYLIKMIGIQTNEHPRYGASVYAHEQGHQMTAPLGDWQSRETQAMTAGNAVPADLPTGSWRCALCMVHKSRGLMHSIFSDGTGYCNLCHAISIQNDEGFSRWVDIQG